MNINVQRAVAVVSYLMTTTMKKYYTHRRFIIHDRAADRSMGGCDCARRSDWIRRRYTSLVPTQLIRALQHPGATAALAELDAVMLGGAATSPALLDKAEQAGIRVVRTYGMSETSGGCVYDGVPLNGVDVRISDGRVLLGGSPLALGYRQQPSHTPPSH